MYRDQNKTRDGKHNNTLVKSIHSSTINMFTRSNTSSIAGQNCTSTSEGRCPGCNNNNNMRTFLISEIKNICSDSVSGIYKNMYTYINIYIYR